MTKTILILIAIFSVALAYYVGENIPFSRQWPLYESLRTTSSIIFAISGAWIAVLYPKTESNITSEKNELKREQHYIEYKKLLFPMIISTFIIFLVLAFGIIAEACKAIDALVKYTKTLRAISFALLTLLTILQLWSILISLAPTDATVQFLQLKSKNESLLKKKFKGLS